MKLHFGAPPENPDFDPEAEGWAGIREPGPILIQFLAVPVALIIAAALVGLLYLVWLVGAVTEPGILIIFYLLALFLVHELLHAACFPGGRASVLKCVDWNLACQNSLLSLL